MDSSAVIEGMKRVLSVGSVYPELVAIEARRSLETAPLSVLGDPITFQGETGYRVGR